MSLRVAVVGCGAWGRHVVREVAASPRARLVAVADVDDAARARAAALAPAARVVGALGDALALGVDAVVVATPAALHEEHATMALEAGAHVLVEKPLCTDPVAADRLVALAARARRVAMVGHILRYHPAAERLVELVASGRLGALRYASATRLSAPRADGDPVLWALGPHDLSLFRAIGSPPLVRAEARVLGADVAFLDAHDAAGRVCRIELSRAHAFRERRFTVVGDRGVATFDDAAPPGSLTVWRRPDPPPEPADLDAFLRASAASAERVAFGPGQPLAREIDHFLACAAEGETPRTPFAEGAEIVRLLAGAEQLARASGQVSA